jgi:acetolactate synthase-1/3 small subunit
MIIYRHRKLFTVIVFSENTVGLLNQISIIFTRRQQNIETLSVAPSPSGGTHKFTITTFSDETTIGKIVKQIDRRVGILKAYYYAEDELLYPALTSNDKLFTN